MRLRRTSGMGFESASRDGFVRRSRRPVEVAPELRRPEIAEVVLAEVG
ncbi:MAG: hypothetical protein KF795_02955 [Labilithrix sp.]|nr:hypothetical protein [Labilithrix sp.]